MRVEGISKTKQEQNVDSQPRQTWTRLILSISRLSHLHSAVNQISNPPELRLRVKCLVSLLYLLTHHRTVDGCFEFLLSTVPVLDSNSSNVLFKRKEYPVISQTLQESDMTDHHGRAYYVVWHGIHACTAVAGTHMH